MPGGDSIFHDGEVNRSTGETVRREAVRGGAPVLTASGERALRVGLVTSQYHSEGPSWGIGSYVRALAEGLLELGHSPCVLIPGRARTQAYFDDKIPVRPVAIPTWLGHLPFPVGRGPSISLARAFASAAEELDLDVVEAPDFSGLAGFLSGMQGRRFALVVRMHTCSAVARAANQTPAGSPRQRLRHWIADTLERRSIVNADAVTAVSSAGAQRTRELLGFSREDFTVIPNPISGLFFRTSAASTSGSNPLLLFVGRLEWIKGPDRLLRAFPEILRHHPTARLLMVGSDSMTAPGGGSMRSYLETLVEPHRPNVEFLGYVPHERMVELYDRASLCVFPSRWEGFPIACQEAMASGRAVVMSDIPVANEIVKDGMTGLIANADEPSALAGAINRLLRDSSLRDRLGSAARDHAQSHWSAKAVAEATVAAYRIAMQRIVR